MLEQELYKEKLGKLEKEFSLLLKTTLPNIQKKLKDLDGIAIQDMDSKIEKNAHDIEGILTSIDSANFQIDSLIGQIVSINNSLKKDIETTTQNASDIEMLKSTLVEASTNLIDLQESFGDLKQIVTAQGNTLTTLGQYAIEDQNKIAKHDEDISKLGESLAAKDASISQNTADISAIQSSIDEKFAELEQLQDKVTDVFDMCVIQGSNVNKLNEFLTADEDIIYENRDKISKLQTDVAANSTKIAKIDTIEESLNSLESTVQTNSTKIEKIDTLETGLNGLKTSVQTNTTNISKNTTDIADLKTASQKAASDIVDLDDRVTDVFDMCVIQGSNVNKLNEFLTADEDIIYENKDNISKLQTDVAANSTNIGKNTTEITALDGKVNDCISKIEALEGGGGGAGGSIRVLDVIYNMSSSDSTVNQGKTSGIKTNGYATYKGDYDTFRIFANLDACGAYVEFSVKNRPQRDITLFAASDVGIDFYLQKVSVDTTLRRIKVGGSYFYGFDKDTSKWTFREESSNYYISRIEGIKWQ